ncbi:MAG: MFS transporter [Chloroflexota bacterium]|nr:MFS transporter [Chloroflexota bacterium]MDE2907863.1 MFS transporter [Chloroflexota bacterium]
MTSASIEIEGETKRESAFDYNRILLICGGHFVHDVYSAFIAPLLPLLIDKLGLTLVMAGSLPVFMQAPSLLGPVIGYLADRFSVRYLVIFAPAITATLASLIGFMPTYGALALLLFCVGVNIMAFHAPAPAMIAHVAGGKVGRGMSFFMAAGELARSVGPLLVGFGVAEWGMQGLWRLMFFGWLASAVLFWRLRDVSAKRERRKTKTKPMLRRFARVFAPLLGVMLLRNMAASSLGIFMVVYLVDIRGFELTLATGALALYEFSGVGGALMGGTLSDRFGRRKMVAGAAICSALLMLVFVHVEGALMIPLLVGMGFTALSVSPVFLALVQDQLPENRATANGMFMLYAFGVRALNVMMVGALGDALGLQNAFIAAALISLLCLPVIITLPSTPAESHEDR